MVQKHNKEEISDYTPSAFMLGVPWGGVGLFVNDMLCISKERKQYRFPKSKKKRIRKKWSKRDKNFKMQDVHSMIVVKSERKIYVSQKAFDAWKASWQASRQR